MCDHPSRRARSIARGSTRPCEARATGCSCLLPNRAVDLSLRRSHHRYSCIGGTAMDNAASDFSLQAFSKNVADLVRAAGRSIVGIHSHRARGSGFAWRPGLIVTADETITDEDRIDVVLPGGDRVRAML